MALPNKGVNDTINQEAIRTSQGVHCQEAEHQHQEQEEQYQEEEKEEEDHAYHHSQHQQHQRRQQQAQEIEPESQLLIMHLPDCYQSNHSTSSVASHQASEPSMHPSSCLTSFLHVGAPDNFEFLPSDAEIDSLDNLAAVHQSQEDLGEEEKKEVTKQ